MLNGIPGLVSILSPAISGGKDVLPGITFFVSKDGNDAWSGKLAVPNAEKTDGPFATITKAKDIIREMKAKQPLSAPVTVMVRGLSLIHI